MPGTVRKYKKGKIDFVIERNRMIQQWYSSPEILYADTQLVL